MSKIIEKSLDWLLLITCQLDRTEYHLEVGLLSMLVGDLLDCVNQCQKTSLLWVVLFPGWDPALYKCGSELSGSMHQT